MSIFKILTTGCLGMILVLSQQIFAVSCPEGMVFVKGDSFVMGNQTGTIAVEQPAHEVFVSSFFMDSAEITQEKYESVTGNNPATGFGVGPDYPVYFVSWFDAVKFCNQRSMSENRELCYTIVTDNDSIVSVSCDFSKNGFRLPTEAEWEFAAKGGNSETSFLYSGSDLIEDVACSDINGDNLCCRVSSAQPNQLGLTDMSGNVYEWCWDWFSENYYEVSPDSNPTGTLTGTAKVARGGSWAFPSEVSRNTYRGGSFPQYRYNFIGFRCVVSCGSDSVMIQEIDLNQGWNLISFYALPENSTPESVFYPVLNELKCVKNQTQTYKPNWPEFLNTLTEMTCQSGYWVRMKSDQVLLTTGEYCSEMIPLKSGWNLIPYSLPVAMTPQEAFASIDNYLLLLKNNSQSYNPDWPAFLITLTEMTPGQGYFIKVSEDCELLYPSLP